MGQFPPHKKVEERTDDRPKKKKCTHTHFRYPEILENVSFQKNGEKKNLYISRSRFETISIFFWAPCYEICFW